MQKSDLVQSERIYSNTYNIDDIINILKKESVTPDTLIMLYELLIRNSLHTERAKNKLRIIADICAKMNESQTTADPDKEVYRQIQRLMDDVLVILP